MAEAFGITAGAVTIAAAFTACVDCFGFIQLGRHFGRDHQTEILALECARLRLSRWGEAVAVHDDPKLGRPDATEADLRNVRDMLQQILILFADSQKISDKFNMDEEHAQGVAVPPSDHIDPAVLAVSNKMKDLAITRQKGSSLIKKTTWALHYRNELKDLVRDVTNIVDNIEKLFPAPTEQQMELVKAETAGFHEKKELQLLSTAADGVDSVLHAATKESMTGHLYLKIVIEGKAHAGDSFAKDWDGPAVSTHNTYEDVTVAAGGSALLGNKYGGKDFWDD